VNDNFSLDRMVSRYVELYQRALAESPGSKAA
jgi:hypothetical protein